VVRAVGIYEYALSVSHLHEVLTMACMGDAELSAHGSVGRMMHLFKGECSRWLHGDCRTIEVATGTVHQRAKLHVQKQIRELQYSRSKRMFRHPRQRDGQAVRER
jgi:hypothetical protein